MFHFFGKKNLVCWLVKSLYGLKQDPQAWHFKLDQYTRDSRIRKTYYEPTCYVINNDYDIVKLFCLCWRSSHRQNKCQQDSTSEIWYLIYFWNYWLKPASLLFRCSIFCNISTLYFYHKSSMPKHSSKNSEWLNLILHIHLWKFA